VAFLKAIFMLFVCEVTAVNTLQFIHLFNGLMTLHAQHISIHEIVLTATMLSETRRGKKSDVQMAQHVAAIVLSYVRPISSYVPTLLW